MYKPHGHTNSALANPLLKSFDYHKNTNGRYTPDTTKMSYQEHSKNWDSSLKRAELMEGEIIQKKDSSVTKKCS